MNHFNTTESHKRTLFQEYVTVLTSNLGSKLLITPLYLVFDQCLLKESGLQPKWPVSSSPPALKLCITKENINQVTYHGSLWLTF